MGTPRSDKTHVEAELSYAYKASKYAGPLSAATSVAPSIYENGGAVAVVMEMLDVPPDGGRGWVLLVGCMIYSAAICRWGLVGSGHICPILAFVVFTALQVWGVTGEYLKTNVFPDASDSALSTLGSVAGMFSTLLSVIPGKLADRYGYKPFLALGGVLWTISMLACAFATKLWHFFLIMGPIQGIANALVFPLIVALPAQWFLKYRTLTTGMVVAGSSLGGAVSMLLFRVMLLGRGFLLLWQPADRPSRRSCPVRRHAALSSSPLPVITSATVAPQRLSSKIQRYFRCIDVLIIAPSSHMVALTPTTTTI